MSMLPNPLRPDQLPKAQFRCVIPCGFGVDLFPLVEPTTPLASDDDDAPPAQSTSAAQARGKGHHAQTKPLLPVAGKKMIDWVLERVEQAGVYGMDHQSSPLTREPVEILVLAPESIAKPVGHHLRARRQAASANASSSSALHPSAKVELEEVPEEIATKNVVRVLMWAVEKGLVSTDFILLPCDLLLSPANMQTPSISLAALLDRHRSDDNFLTTLFSERAAGSVVEARKDGPPEILTIYDRKSSTLLDFREMDDYDDDEVPLRTSLLSKFPSPTLTTSLLPTQLYIYSSLVLPILASPVYARRLRHIEDLQTLAGWLARQSWRHQHSPSLPLRSSSSQNVSSAIGKEEPLAMGRSTTQRPAGIASRFGLGADRAIALESPGFSGTGPASAFATGANTPALVSRASFSAGLASTIGPGGGGGSGGGGVGAGGKDGKLLDAEGAMSVLSGKGGKKARAGAGGCKVVVWRQADGFAARGNTVAGFVEINRAALKLLPASPAPTNTPSGVWISPDSHLHLSVYPNLGEKVAMKRCIVGKNTRVGKGSKLTNCVVMEGVVIGENVKLDNCVVSNGVQVRDRASLKDCEIGRDVIVDFDSQVKGEQMVVEDD
ncbi:hypothetical protein BMF94_0468 [Rhodotorula taiwanensis]|uniref:Translation initiation factor eIF2B subunit gamma n=1 Tax=Rhodotorula taiwanensis TaxID=741276 RepID=A0A2S5BHP7_9BASI|nr:hypothetical protein BMF94_0468 [Rhodotorula taiwanensis]